MDRCYPIARLLILVLFIFPCTSYAEAYRPYGDADATVTITIQDSYPFIIAGLNGETLESNGKQVRIISADDPVGFRESESALLRESAVFFDSLVVPPGTYTLSFLVYPQITFYATEGSYTVSNFHFVIDGIENGIPVVTDADERIVGTKQATSPGTGGDLLIGLQKWMAESMLSSADPAELNSFSYDGDAYMLRTFFIGAHYGNGMDLFKKGKMTEALAALDRAIGLWTFSLAPQKLRGVFIHRAQVLLSLGNAAEAINAVNLGLDTIKADEELPTPGLQDPQGIDPSWLAWAHYIKGGALMAQSENSAARAEFTTSIDVSPNPDAYVARANIDATTGNFEQAGADVELAIELQPNNAKLWAAKSYIHFAVDSRPDGCSAAQKACDLGDCRMIDEYSESMNCVLMGFSPGVFDQAISDIERMIEERDAYEKAQQDQPQIEQDAEPRSQEHDATLDALRRLGEAAQKEDSEGEQ